jgi:hypothetical protein
VSSTAAGKASERFVWAVDTLDVRPAEVGRGHGVAVSLVCGYVNAGRAVLEAVALENADLGDRHFEDGLVSIFWDARHSARERAQDLGNELAGLLGEGGFSVDSVSVEDLRPVPAVCVMGRPDGSWTLA